jgi:hypothetical protein
LQDSGLTPVPDNRSIKRFLALAAPNKSLIVEAMASLLIASLAIRLLPFRRVFPMAARPLGPKSGLKIRQAVWAVEAAAARVPWKTVCFHKGLALQSMLRRRGIDAQLHYGVGFDPARSVCAHVWVSAGGDIVIGGEEAPAFRLLASTPPGAAETW